MRTTQRLSFGIALIMFLVTQATNEARPAVGAEKTLHSAVKPHKKGKGWMKRHESFNKRVKQGNVDLIFIGDSITHGWEGAGKEVWEKFYGKRNAVNLGIGGDRTQHVLWRLDNGNVDGISPKLAVIMIGTNNARRNTPPETTDGVTAIVEKLRKKQPEMKLLLLAVFPRGPDAKNEHRLANDKVNQAIAKLHDGKMIHFLDIGPKFLETDGKLTRKIMPDLLHLSPKGYTTWAESIEAKVAELMAEKP